jgi:hypothetical protein
MAQASAIMHVMYIHYLSCAGGSVPGVSHTGGVSGGGKDQERSGVGGMAVWGIVTAIVVGVFAALGGLFALRRRRQYLAEEHEVCGYQWCLPVFS